MSKTCTFCNAELTPNAPFCTSCGARVTGTPATGPTVTLPQLPPEAERPVAQPLDQTLPAMPQIPPTAPLADTDRPAEPVAAATDRPAESAWSPTVPSASPTPYTPQQYAPPQGTVPQYNYAPPTIPTSNSAIVSLVFGILAWVLLPLIGAIVAVVAGHMARGEIRRSEGQIQGGGLAIAGLILGYIQIVMLVLGCAFFLVLIGIGAATSGS